MCPGQLAFTLANREDSSTFDLTEEEAKRAGFRQVLVEVETLNEIVRSSGLPPDLVKIDAEGLDLRVFKYSRCSQRKPARVNDLETHAHGI